jgi:hypothetical protein
MMPLTRLHVNQLIIRQNSKEGTRHPVLTVKRRGKTFTAHEAVINGPSKLVYSPDKPLSCGAKVWIECNCAVVLDGKELP